MINLGSMFQKVFGKLANKIANEPVFLSGLAIVGLQAFNEAQTAGLNVEDAFLYASQLVIVGLARELVWPAVKINSATQTPKVPEEPLEPPYLGEPSE